MLNMITITLMVNYDVLIDVVMRCISDGVIGVPLKRFIHFRISDTGTTYTFYLYLILLVGDFVKGTLYQCESVKFGYNSTLEALAIFLNIPRTSL